MTSQVGACGCSPKQKRSDPPWLMSNWSPSPARPPHIHAVTCCVNNPLPPTLFDRKFPRLGFCVPRRIWREGHCRQIFGVRRLANWPTFCKSGSASQLEAFGPHKKIRKNLSQCFSRACARGLHKGFKKPRKEFLRTRAKGFEKQKSHQEPMRSLLKNPQRGLLKDPSQVLKNPQRTRHEPT